MGSFWRILVVLQGGGVCLCVREYGDNSSWSSLFTRCKMRSSLHLAIQRVHRRPWSIVGLTNHCFGFGSLSRQKACLASRRVTPTSVCQRGLWQGQMATSDTAPLVLTEQSLELRVNAFCLFINSFIYL